MDKENGLIKNYSYLSLIINIVAIVFTILPTIGLSTLGTISVIIFIVTVAVDLALIYLTLDSINRSDSKGQTIKKLCWIYLIFFFFAILALMTDALVYSFVEVGSILRTLSYIFAQIAYYAIYGLGIFTSYYNLQHIDRPETWK